MSVGASAGAANVGETDGALIERSRREPEAFAGLFDRHAVEFHRYVARRLDPTTAEDIVSEAFLIAFRKRDQFATSCHDARPWLYGIVTRLLGNHRRSEARKYRALARSDASAIEESPDERVTARVDAEHTSRRLGSALGRLAPRDRDVVFLFAWQQLGYAEISVALNIPVGTVRSRLNRARRKISKELGETHFAALQGKSPMDEFDKVRGLWTQMPEPRQQWLFQTRNRLTEEARSGSVSRLPRWTIRPNCGVGRAAAVGALSVALAGGIITTQTVDLGGGSPAATARADVILQKAAAAASDHPPAQPGDFAYVETKAMGTSVRGSPGEGEKLDTYQSRRMRWNSVDGSERGLSRIQREGGLIDGRWRERTVPVVENASLAHPTYSYLRSLPHDADKLAAKIREFCSSSSDDECRGGPFAVISGLLTRHVVPSEVRTALFEAAGKFKGVTVIEDAKLPVTGERGVAVALAQGEGTKKVPGERTELIFDPETYAFLGVREVATEKQDAGAQNVEGGTVPAGTVLHSLAVVEKGIVPDNGQQP